MSLDRSKIRSGAVIVFFVVLALLGLAIDSKKWIGQDGLDLKQLLHSWVSLGLYAFVAFIVFWFVDKLDE